jgi:hypothetical protein
MSKTSERQPLQCTSRSTNSHRASETAIREYPINFEAPTPQNSPTKHLDDPWKGPIDLSSPSVGAKPPAKCVHVDNDVMQALEILLQKKMEQRYSGTEALDVARNVFDALPTTEDSETETGRGVPLIVDLEEFQTLAKGWALGMAAKCCQGPSINQAGKDPRLPPIPKGTPLERDWPGTYQGLTPALRKRYDSEIPEIQQWLMEKFGRSGGYWICVSQLALRSQADED